MGRGRRTLLKPLACLYHSLTLFNVVFRVRSNMNNIATASFETRGSIETNSRWPPRSQICSLAQMGGCVVKAKAGGGDVPKR